MKIYTNRANQSLSFILYLLKKIGIKEIFIPDQGGWFTYKILPKYYDLKIKVLRTHLGMPIEEELKEIRNSALIICSSPGYLRDLSKFMWQIKEILNENNSFLINDNSSGFSNEGDIVFMSFGHWKPINLGLGGLLEIKNQDLQEFAKKENLEKFFKLQVKLNQEIINKAKNRLEKLDELVEEGINLAKKFKKEFKEYLIKEIRKERSLNVGLEYSEELINILKEKNLPYRKMPDYIRLKIKGISLETKRIAFPEN